jgi:cytoskeletal protein RodZ
MTGFGGALRAERERCNLTLQAIAGQTKIAVRHLQALEDEDFAQLPGGVFRRGIARAYVLALQLDETSWMADFQASHDAFLQTSGEPPVPDGQAWAAFAENVKRSRIQQPRRLDLRWLGLLAMLLTLAAAAWAVWRYVLQSRIR